MYAIVKNQKLKNVPQTENSLQFQDKCKKVTKADPLPKKCRNNLTKNPTRTAPKFRKIKITTPLTNNFTK